MSATAPPVQAPARTRSAGWGDLVAIQKRFPAIQLVATIAVFVVGATTLDGFTSGPSLKLMLVLAALAGIAALG